MRRKGEGTITRRKDGRYEVAISLGAGTRKRVYLKTEHEAIEKLDELRGTHRKGLPFADEKTNVCDYLTKEWLEAMRPPRVRVNTWVMYESTVRRQLVPRLGRHKLAKLMPGHVESAMDAAVKDGISPSGARAMRAVLRIALHRAQRDGRVHRNVAALADPVKVTPKEVTPFSPDEAALLVRGMGKHRLQALWLLMLGTGMRHGEALALTWRDLDLDAGVVHIRRSLERWQGFWRLVEMTKTLRSRRDLPLPAYVVTALNAHADRQLWESTKAGGDKPGSKWKNDFDLIFTTETGGPLHESTVQHQFAALLDELGLPRRRVYDLRHSAASFLIANGMDLRSVMEQLGHSQIALTANTYGHIYMERKREMASVMDKMLVKMADNATKTTTISNAESEAVAQ